MTAYLSTRAPVRMDMEGGPWSISVAEAPHDARSYTLYVKTPTHNLTLTRSVKEIIELHGKLKEAYAASVPALPTALLSASLQPPKRKSTFLNTLSRFASPASSKTSSRRSNYSNPTLAPPSSFTSPLVTPQNEPADPFASFGDSTNGSGSNDVSSTRASSLIAATNSTSTAVAAYLTTVSNAQDLRQTRAWRRFTRVRTDDLESIRVERAIKRVRSDLASHASPKSTADTHSVARGSEKENIAPSAPHSTSSKHSLIDEPVKEEDEGANKNEEAATGREVQSALEQEMAPAVPEPEPATGTDSKAVDDMAPATPTVDSARMHRSQSADRSSRLSRAYTTSASTADQTGSETSASTTTEHRSAKKKRSTSTDPAGKEPKKRSYKKVIVDDFEMLRVLGKGCAGKVLLVRHKSSSELYAMKAITKRHVLAHQELQHTLTEQAVLKKMAAGSRDPFVVKLWWSFHDKENLFLVMDFHPGGDLATQLARWGRLGRDRARFYAAEIVEGVEGLHAAGVIYRDLKPENILIGSDGHIVLTDFGLSKEFDKPSTAVTAHSTPSGSRTGFYSSVPGTSQPVTPPWMKADKSGELALGYPGPVAGHSDSTSTFCGTAEYLAPEVIQGLAYSYEVDWWSFGTMLYEMLTGITPFWANNHSDMYLRVLQDELAFPDDRAMDPDTKSLLRGLLQRNPVLRISEPRIKRHPYFSMIDWTHVYYKRYIPPYIPPIDPANASDTQNFDETFLDMEPVLDDPNEYQTDTDQEREQTDTDRTDGEDANTPSQSRSSSSHPLENDEEVDVFDGYSFKGRHSVLIDEEEERSSSEEGEDNEDVDLSELQGIDVTPAEESVTEEAADESAEPKTPEARPSALPEEAAEEPPLPPPKAEPPVPSTEVAKPSRRSKDLPPARFVEDVPRTPDRERPPRGNRFARRREKSGVPALDKYISDEDTEATGREDDDEDDDWDFIEAVDGEERNGAKGTSLFARGVVDRYKLAVFRKASTPSARSNPRSFSGMSDATSTTATDSPESNSPSQKRGRTPLSFRKNPRQFLQPKSPSSKGSMASKSFSSSTSATLSAASSSSTGGLLTPSPSAGKSSMASKHPSLRSKESTLSMGVESISSDQSGNGDAAAELTDSGKNVHAGERDKHKKKKLKKYKQNAEKMFNMFTSPRP